MSTANKYVTVFLILYGTGCTERALAFHHPEDLHYEPVWIPRKLIHNLEDVLDSLPAGPLAGINREVEMELPRWLVEEKGLDMYAEEME